FPISSLVFSCSIIAVPAGVLTWLPKLSSTCTATVKVAPAVVLTGGWVTNASILAGPGMMVRMNAVDKEGFVIDAVTVTGPVCVPAVGVVDLAIPAEFVVAVTVANPPKETVGALAGAVNVTVTSGMGLPKPSLTSASRGTNMAPAAAL